MSYNSDRERVRLGVNVDHIATIRQARGTAYPDPVFAAGQCELASADQITIHLREDRRHIQERDLAIMSQTLAVPLNLEMAPTEEMVGFALKYKPSTVTLVPEKRQELTTEGGLDVVGALESLTTQCARMKDAGIIVSMFIDPERAQVLASLTAGAATVELHTGSFCDAPTQAIREMELARLLEATLLAHESGLTVAAGHGIDYHNVREIMRLPFVEELNIGHAIVARALFEGLPAAVREMRRRMDDALLSGG